MTEMERWNDVYNHKILLQMNCLKKVTFPQEII